MTENTKRKITVMKGIGRNGDMNANESKVEKWYKNGDENERVIYLEGVKKNVASRRGQDNGDGRMGK